MAVRAYPGARIVGANARMGTIEGDQRDALGRWPIRFDDGERVALPRRDFWIAGEESSHPIGGVRSRPGRPRALTDDQEAGIGRAIRSGASIDSLALAYNVHRSTICAAVKRQGVAVSRAAVRARQHAKPQEER